MRKAGIRASGQDVGGEEERCQGGLLCWDLSPGSKVQILSSEMENSWEEAWIPVVNM